MTGRPTIRTEAMVDEIIRRLAEGEFLAAICRDEGMPHPSTFRRWADEDDELSRRFARAREDGEEAILAETLAIADDASGDFVPSKKGPVFDAEHVQRSKLRIETRIKALAKFNPKRWGDKVEHTGPGGGPVQFAVVTSVPEAEPAAPQGDDDA